jgi:hypothetical protein
MRDIFPPIFLFTQVRAVDYHIAGCGGDTAVDQAGKLADWLMAKQPQVADTMDHRPDLPFCGQLAATHNPPRVGKWTPDAIFLVNG